MSDSLSPERTFHHLKCWTEFYMASWRGDKPWEFRKNDRDYKKNDLIVLHEYDPTDKTYVRGTMDSLIRRILYVAKGELIPEGHVIMTVDDLSASDVMQLNIEQFRRPD